MKFSKQFRGWLLDISTFSRGVILWVKKDGCVVKIFHEFHPEFFAVPNKGAGNDFKKLKYIIKAHPNVNGVRICEKFVRLENSEKTKVLGVSVKTPSVFKTTIEEINKIGLFTLYNTDLPISQMYFYVNDLFPMSYCSFEVNTLKKKNKNEWRYHLLSIKLEDDNERLFYDLPPLKAIWLEVKIHQQGEIRPYFNDPLICAEISVIENDANNIPRADGYKKRKIIIDEADEAETLKKLSKVIESLDPDIILTQGGDDFIIPYLVARASFNHVSKDLYLSRDRTPIEKCVFNLSGGSHYMSYGIIRRRSKTQVYLTGRLHLDTSAYGSLHFSEGNIPGVIEVSRISRVPIQRLCRITIGGALQSIQFYNTYKLDHLIPPFKKSPEEFNSALNLIRNDRGGHIFEPLIGVFEQVVELDFSSMYPSLMVNFNISSETLNCKCCKDDGTGIKVPGLDYHICTKREGIISKSISLPLNKRLKYKAHVRQTGEERYKFTDIALKWVLVVSFGYLGFKNARFGKIEAHQAVCAFSREFLMRSAEIAEKYGFRVIHGIVDSIWIQDTKGRVPKEIEQITRKIANEITEHTTIQMSWDGRFDTIVFLPSRAERDVPALSHYWGIKSDGEIKVRGIEVRRRDAPKIVKNAQYAFIDVFKGAKSVEEFMDKIPEAKKKLYEYVHRIEKGNVTKEELIIMQHVSRKPSQYKVNSYQAIAARQLERTGVRVTPGMNVQYIILNADAHPDFPEKKVILSYLYNPKTHQYDKKKYIELLKRAFENLFPVKCPDLKLLLTKDYNNTSIQKSLSCFIK